jgi:uncharacterized membrane protein YeaQ/YmgE (transglycosylase-associated protein family)
VRALHDFRNVIGRLVVVLFLLGLAIAILWENDSFFFYHYCAMVCAAVWFIAGVIEAIATSRYSLRSLLLFNLFMGCLAGFIAACVKEPLHFHLLLLIFTAGFLGATVASLLSDRKRLGKPGAIPPEARGEPPAPRGHPPGAPGDGQDGKADLP